MVKKRKYAEDILDDILQRMQQDAALLEMVVGMAPTFHQRLEEIARATRDDWPDKVSRRDAERLEKRDNLIREAYRKGERVPYLALKYDISKRRVFKIVEDL